MTRITLMVAPMLNLLLRGLVLMALGVPLPAAAVERAERVLVDKSERKLYLIRGGYRYRAYSVALGGEPDGTKLRAGDSRTPEGWYTLDWRNPHSRYYKSLHISYPDPYDRAEAARQGLNPGGMIMVHGEYGVSARGPRYQESMADDWTEGCVALSNHDMDEVWFAVADGTPIEIRP